MKHEDFPVKRFDFMDEPATDEQKEIILGLWDELGVGANHNGRWPDPFTKWDAGQLIEVLKEKI